MATYSSPLTGERWHDVRPILGVLATFTLALVDRRPRRRLPPEQATAVARAVAVATSFASLPGLQRNDLAIGTAISDAYWEAKAVRNALRPFLDETFVRNAEYWPSWHDWINQQDPDGWAAKTLNPPILAAGRIARLAWWAATLTEKAASGGVEQVDEFSVARDFLLGAVIELREAGLDEVEVGRLEGLWRFVTFVGRLPVTQADHEALDAVDALVMADAEAGVADLLRAYKDLRRQV